MLKVAAAFLGVLWAIAGASGQEQVSLIAGQTQTLQLRRPMATVIVANEGIVRAEPVAGSVTALRLTAIANGQTTLTVQDDKGLVFFSSIVTVGLPERIITIISRQDDKSRKQKGLESTTHQLKLHDEYSYRCNQERCIRFTPRNRPLDESQPALTPDQPQD